MCRYQALIGPNAAKKLAEAGVSSTFALIGKFLSFKEADVDPTQHADRFYTWLASVGMPPKYRAGVVQSIGEKMNILFAADEIYIAEIDNV